MKRTGRRFALITCAADAWNPLVYGEIDVFRINIWLTSLLITTGVVGGVVYNWPTDTSDSVSPTSSQSDDSSDVNQIHSKGLSLSDNSQIDLENVGAIEFDLLQRGDRLLRVGNYIGAYQVYSKLAKSDGDQTGPTLAIRLGQAAELAGFTNHSEQHYLDVIQASDAGKHLQAWAMLGTARLWHSQQRDSEANSLLSELYLRYASGSNPLDLRVAVTQSLAEFLQHRIVGPADESDLSDKSDLPDKSDLRDLKYFRFKTNVESVLSLAEGVSGDPQSDQQVPVTILQKPLLDVSVILVQAKLPLHSLNQLLSDLRSGMGMEILASAHANRVLSGRSVELNVDSIPASVLLDQVLSPLGLIWGQDDGELSIMHRTEVPQAIQREYALARVQRLLRQLQLNSTNKDIRAMALMHDGNNSVWQGDISRARNMLAASRELQPGGELSAMLYFNTALLDQSLGNSDQALNAYYLALDQTSSNAIQAASYAKIAKMELILGRPDKAIRAAARGARLPGRADVVSDNVMTLAKAYLFDSDPNSANRVLFKHADSVAEDAKRFATVIASYARLQVLSPARGVQNETERLVLSLVALHPGDLQSAIDNLIVSRAYFTAGFRSKAIEHLDIAAANAINGHWSEAIGYELAEKLFNAGEYESADLAIRAILEVSTSSPKAKLLQVRLQFKLGQYDACSNNCYELLKTELSDEEKGVVLSLLGKTYQKSGQHYAAALCFAGLLPESARAFDAGDGDVGPTL